MGFVLEVVHATDAFEPSGWLALASLGVALVGVTAWLERRARAIRFAETEQEFGLGLFMCG